MQKILWIDRARLGGFSSASPAAVDEDGAGGGAGLDVGPPVAVVGGRIIGAGDDRSAIVDLRDCETRIGEGANDDDDDDGEEGDVEGCPRIEGISIVLVPTTISCWLPRLDLNLFFGPVGSS